MICCFPGSCVCVCVCMCKRISNGYLPDRDKNDYDFQLKNKIQTKEMRSEGDTRMSSSLCGTIAPNVVLDCTWGGNYRTHIIVYHLTAIVFLNTIQENYYPLVTLHMGKIRLRNAFSHRYSGVCSGRLGHSVPSSSPFSYPPLLKLVHYTEQSSKRMDMCPLSLMENCISFPSYNI